jgi:hypothetical protein
MDMQVQILGRLLPAEVFVDSIVKNGEYDGGEYLINPRVVVAEGRAIVISGEEKNKAFVIGICQHISDRYRGVNGVIEDMQSPDLVAVLNKNNFVSIEIQRSPFYQKIACSLL